jgi:hypothetical protein
MPEVQAALLGTRWRRRSPEERRPGGMPTVQQSGASGLKLDMIIDTLKIRLNQMGAQYGLDDLRVLRLSQRLDVWIVRKMRQIA